MGFEMFASRSKMAFGGARPSAMALQDSSNYLLSWAGYILLARTLVPPEIQWLLKKIWALFLRPYTSFFCVFHVYERHQESGRKNDLYKLVELYLDITGLCRTADQAVLATQAKKEKDILYKLTGRESVEDRYNGVKVWWSLKASGDGDAPKKDPPRGGREKKGDKRSDKSEFLLKMHKKDKHFVMTEYLDHVVAEAEEFKRQQKELKLFSNNGSRWSKSFTFKHPSTFETLAMNPGLKAAVKADLDSFRQSEAYFRRVGRAWKRGYLLYGPPGTGKSSMIAAMANYLKYDVYDLELTQVYSNDGLKKLFRDTSSRSIVVIEDIDCSLNLAGRRKSAPPPPRHIEDIRELKMRARRPHIREESVTLSALLNAVDGLWSCTTDERIVIFTTNHVEKLDPALIRPGRMDMRIHMSYCSFHSFQELARSYLSIHWHPEYDKIRRLIEDNGALITPAQVTEYLFGLQDDPTACMRSIVAALRKSRKRNPNSRDKTPAQDRASKLLPPGEGEGSEIGVAS